MIIITGATGLLGKKITEQLIEMVPAEKIGLSVRDAKKAESFNALGIRVREGDFESFDSLKYAFEGASQVLIISSNARVYGGDTIAQHKTAIDAAKAVGAQRIVYTSHMAANDHSAFPPMLDHAQTEELLAQSGIEWTALRNGFYANSGIDMLTNLLKNGNIKTPRDGKISWTAHDDLAKAAAIILAKEGLYNGATPPLTATESLDLRDLINLVSKASGKTITHQTLTDEEYRQQMKEAGTPSHVVDIALGLFLASRSGEFEQVDPTLEQLIGHKPISMQSLVEGAFKNL